MEHLIVKKSVKKSKKVIILSVIVISLALVSTGYKLGSHVQKKQDQAWAKAHTSGQITNPSFIGKVSDISKTSITVTTIKSKKSSTFAITKDTEIYLNSKKTNTDTVKKGLLVIIYPEEANKNNARHITVLAAPKFKAPAK